MVANTKSKNSVRRSTFSSTSCSSTLHSTSTPIFPLILLLLCAWSDQETLTIITAVIRLFAAVRNSLFDVFPYHCRRISSHDIGLLFILPCKISCPMQYMRIICPINPCLCSFLPELHRYLYVLSSLSVEYVGIFTFRTLQFF